MHNAHGECFPDFSDIQSIGSIGDSHTRNGPRRAAADRPGFITESRAGHASLRAWIPTIYTLYAMRAGHAPLRARIPIA